MNWWARLTRRDHLEAQLDAELRDHYERLVTEYLRAGLTEPEARRKARLEFGGLDQIKEVCRDARGTRWIEELTQDIRYGARGFRKNGSFTFVAAVTLALGVGANMAIFNLVDALLLRPLPVPDAHELVTLLRIQGGNSSEHFSYPQVKQLAEQPELFSTLAGIGSDTLHVGPPHALEPTGAAWVSGGHFATLRITPAAGRFLNPADDQPGATPAAVITHNYWTGRLGSDPDAVGRLLLIEGVQVPIVGITPRGFTGATVGEFADVTMALSVRPRIRPESDSLGPDSRWLRILARPHHGLTREQLQARLDMAWQRVLPTTLSARMNAESRARALTMTLSVQSGVNGTSSIRASFRRPLAIAMALVTLVLVIACVNVANLLLARGATRAREIALRFAIGAGRGRIVRQLLTESALLSVAGTVIGVALGAGGSYALLTIIASGLTGPEDSAVMLNVAPNWRAAGVAALVVATTTLVFGVIPAWRASLVAPGMISAGASRVTASHGRLATSLIVAQISLSLALVVGAGLFARSLHNLRGLDRGFRTDSVLLVGVDATRAGYSSPQLQAFNQSVLTAVEGLPGVRAVSVAAITPLQGGGMSQSVLVNGVSTGLEEVYFNVIGPRYFDIMHTPFLTGRDFTPHDDGNAPAVVIVNQAFVRRHLGEATALGQRVTIGGSPREMQIVGVVKDAVYETLRAAPPPTVYVSYQQHRGRPMTLVIDAPGTTAAATDAIRAEIQPKVPARPLRFRTLAAQVEGSLVRERLMMLVTTLLGGLALSLAAVGLYGLVSYSVTNRTREIGVRLALGAKQSAIQRWVLQDALRMVAIGTLVGLPAAWLVSRLIAAMIFRVTPTDPATTAGAVIVLALVGLVAAIAPARRAARVDPIRSLRAE